MDTLYLVTSLKVGDNQGATPFLTRLIGKRMAVYCENDITDVLKTENIKNITGGDTFLGFDRFGESYEFKCNATLILITNFAPQFNLADTGIVKRARYMHFKKKFVDKPRDDHPEEALRDRDLLGNVGSYPMMPHFLAWCIQGAVKMYNNRVKEPKFMKREL